MMRSTPRLTEARPLGDYVVHVGFEDGTTADVDLSYLLDYGGVFEPLRDPTYFAQLRPDTEASTIVWPNDADIAPEALYVRAQRRAASTAVALRGRGAVGRRAAQTVSETAVPTTEPCCANRPLRGQ
jgi:hypothetical protein